MRLLVRGCLYVAEYLICRGRRRRTTAENVEMPHGARTLHRLRKQAVQFDRMTLSFLDDNRHWVHFVMALQRLGPFPTQIPTSLPLALV